MLRKKHMVKVVVTLLWIGMLHILQQYSHVWGEEGMPELFVGMRQTGISSRRLQVENDVRTQVQHAGITKSQIADISKASIHGNADSSSENLLPASAWLRGQVNISSRQLQVKNDTATQIQRAGITESQTADASKASMQGNADSSSKDLLPALAWLQGQINISRWYDAKPPDELLDGRLSREMCQKRILPDTLIYDYMDWYTHGEKIGEWLQRYSGNKQNSICWGEVGRAHV
eukprot:TRINITY_DN4768_c0_g1_i4.p1 TRINITY_DN4768_c0_g1~~TRINITY_DN4768_c0_g1_i4.p1  ORF type:complete len:232 (-),score=47.91 TRINITY_DN4768_c0_g1_i4:32-727(-)